MRMLTDTRADSPRPAVRRLRLPALLLMCAPLAGCYLMQAASGQWQVLRRRVPIESVIIDPRTPAPLRLSLENARSAREFASRELQLPDNRSYRSYADIGRRYVVWSVVAAPEFSVSPRQWCFPVVGCVAYRGYFSERRARRFAATLSAAGADVVVEGIPAYSTLQWFADPVLSTMLRDGDDEVAAMIFHELAHQLLYVQGDVQFNEAFATAVAQEGMRRWLSRQGATQRLARWRRGEQFETAVVRLLLRARQRLASLYASGQQPQQMREQKAREFAGLRRELDELQRTYHREISADWLAAGFNNARLASVATYYDCVPGFQRLLAASGDNLPRFYAAARELAQRSRAQRHAQLCGTAPAALEGGEGRRPAGTAR
ncbi:MAG: aminopeptidase [Proteobacteria bacterium]|nr:aminopeptidase [Pseudomonadota bacterium]